MNKPSKYNVEELLAIDNYLQLYGHKKSFDNLVVLNGYIAAIVCSKQILMPSQWMNAIWGGPQNQPIWEDEIDFVKFTHYVSNHFNYVKSAMERESYSPMVYDIGKSQAQKYQPWCLGFIIGSQYWNQSIEDFDYEMNKHYGIISIFANSNPKALLKELKINLDLRSFNIADSLFTAVYIIRQYIKENCSEVISARLTNLNNAVPKNIKGKKIGRNHPCPCGSGKKYKKCCINN